VSEVIAAIIGSVGLIGIIIYLIVFHLEKLEYFASRVLSLFLWLGSGIRKKAISKEIRAKILKVSKEITKEVSTVLPYDLKINWVKETNIETFIQDNKIVIRMNNKQNKTGNIVYALTQYIENGLLPYARKYIDTKVMKSADMVMVRKLLAICHVEGLDHFDQSFLIPLLSSDEEIQEYIDKMIKLDDAGIFVRVLLNEYMFQSKIIYPKVPDQRFMRESKELVSFLYNVATKGPGEIVELSINGEYFRIGVIIIARNEVLDIHGTQPYIYRAISNLNKGLKKVYLFADTEFKSQCANEVASYIKENDLRVKYVKRLPYKRKYSNGITMKGICIEISTIEDYDMEASAS
jgi:hypothetical protein